MMDDMNAFERQLSNVVQRAARPPRPVDAMTIVTAATTSAPRWRLQSMFSATKFVVAGVIVALFGGFLLSGVLTTQRREESPPAVGASSSAEASTETRDDLLPGVDLVTEEVEPGVFRVLHDGSHDLSAGVWQVAATTDGEIFVQKHRTIGHGRDKWRVLQVGEPGVSFRDEGQERVERNRAGLDLHTVDGEVVGIARVDRRFTPSIERQTWRPASSEAGAQRYDNFGRRRGGASPWTTTFASVGCEPAQDGSCWSLGESEDGHDVDVLHVVDDETPVQHHRGRDIFAGKPVGFGSPDVHDVEVADDGTVWAIRSPWVASYDGDSWTTLPDITGAGDKGTFDAEIEVDGDGVVWILGQRRHFDEAQDRFVVDDTLLGRWDGTSWTTFEPDAAPGVGTELTIGPDGTVWVGPLTWFDGATFHRFDAPISDGNAQPELVSAAHAPDGSVWVAMVDRSETGDQACPTFCEGEPEGLYVITPEAVAATD